MPSREHLARLEEVIGEETMALEARHSIDLQEFNRRKSRSLLELTRIIRALPPKVMDDGVRLRIDRLRLGLVRNKELLRIHLSAAQEIAEVLAGAIGDAESDGTYGRAIKPARPHVMVKILIAGAWACLVALGASYGAVSWQSGGVRGGGDGGRRPGQGALGGAPE